MTRKTTLLFFCIAMFPLCAEATDPGTPEEFGKVTFLRDYPTALAKAKADKKPLFVLFDEIPG